jgi:hypothetical protein
VGVKRRKTFTGSDIFKERRSWKETGQLPGGEGLEAKKKKEREENHYCHRSGVNGKNRK